MPFTVIWNHNQANQGTYYIEDHPFLDALEFDFKVDSEADSLYMFRDKEDRLPEIITDDYVNQAIKEQIEEWNKKSKGLSINPDTYEGLLDPLVTRINKYECAWDKAYAKLLSARQIYVR
jgi:hypothetical protein